MDVETPLHPSARARGRLLGEAYVAVLPSTFGIVFDFTESLKDLAPSVKRLGDQTAFARRAMLDISLALPPLPMALVTGIS